MSKKFKIAVSNTVLVHVKGEMRDADGKPAPFKFDLVCDRKTSDEIKAALETPDFNFKAFMLDVTSGWNGQRLVLVQEEGQPDRPAEFSREAMDELLNISGMALLCFNSYGRDSGAQAKN